MGSPISGWEMKTLGQVASFVMGQAPAGEDCNKVGQGVPFVKAGEFGASRPFIREWTTDPRKLGKRSDVFVCVVGATCGKINLGDDCAIGRSVAAIRPDESLLDQFFLHYYLQGLVETLRRSSLGAAQTVISKDMLSELQIPVPELEVQKRVVAKLDQAFAALDRARANAGANVADAQSFLDQALHQCTFGAYLDHPENYVTCNLIDAIEEIRNGINCDQKSGGHDRISRIETIATGALDLGRVGYSTLSSEQKRRARLCRNDILFSHINSVPHVGKTAIIDDDEELYHGINLLLIRPIPSIDPGYMNLFLRALKAKKYWEKVCKKSVNQASVNQQDIARVPFFYPKKSVQRKICESFAEVERHGSTIADSYRSRGNELMQLRQSLLQVAFSGQLT